MPPHDHTHGADPDAPACSTEALGRRRQVVIRTLVGAIALVLAVPVTTAAGLFATAADSRAGAATERRVTAVRARFAR